MSLLPVSTNRVSTPLTNQRLLFQLNNDQLAIQRQYDQLSTGQRVLRLSDDPAAAGRAISLHRGIDRSDQLARNADSTSSFYRAADSALNNVDNALIEARAAAVSGAQSVLSDDERAGLAATIQETINSVFASGNTIFRDHQILGGFLGQENAFERSGNEIVFTGNTAIANTKVGSGANTAVNVNAIDSLGVFTPFVEGQPLDATIDRDTRLVDLRQGRGVQPGLIRVSGGSEFIDVDLQNAATVGDLVDIISSVEVEGRDLSASIVNGALQVGYLDGAAGTLAIDDVAGSSTAEDLSILNSTGTTAPPITGDPLTPQVTLQTKLTDLNNGGGVDLGSGILIDQGGEQFVITFDDAVTLGDVLLRINRSDADVHAELDAAEGRILVRGLRSGVDYSIGENGGDDATELGIRSATEDNLISGLNRGVGLRYNLDAPDLTIVRPDGVQLDFELEDARTVQDVIDLIRNHPDNQDARRARVELNTFGNGLTITAPPGAIGLTVRQNGTSDAGVQLGLIEAGENERVGSTIGAVSSIVGNDYSPKDAGGALDTLLRLEDAIREGDLPEIGRLQAKLDGDLDQASRTRGLIGVWSRNVDQLKDTAENNAIELRSQLSNEVDADLATVISELNQRQASLEASLRFIGQTAQLTLLNFL